MTAHALQGAVAFYKGAAAEESVLRCYQALGFALEARRFRGQGAEIDLIFRKSSQIVFVEVKAAASFEAAAFSLSERQKIRLLHAAEGYLAAWPGLEARFDLALVAQQGAVQIFENAIFS